MPHTEKLLGFWHGLQDTVMLVEPVPYDFRHPSLLPFT
jgi:hypothetical protein